MRIGINAVTLEKQGGIGTYIINLIKHLEKIDRINEYILYSNPITADRYTPKEENFFVKSVNELYRIPGFLYLVYFSIELKRRKIELFHGPCFLLPPVKVCKYIVTIHDLTFKVYPQMMKGLDSLYYNLFVPLSAKNADVIIADSFNTKKDIIKYLGIDEKKIEVVYPGVDERFSPIQNISQLDNFQRRYNLPANFILTVSTLEPRKNIIRLVNAYHKLKTSLDHKLVIAGAKGWKYSSVFERVKELNLQNSVIFTNYIPDEELPLLYNLADMFVFPSLYEGFGLPVLEAMACGTPVITSNVASLPEVIGEAGLLINPLNENELVNAIYQVLSDKKLSTQLAQKGIKQAKLFSWEKSALEIKKIYERILYGYQP